jgi:hypothetical protein
MDSWEQRLPPAKWTQCLTNAYLPVSIFCISDVVRPHEMPRQSTPTQGKSVTFGVTRGCLAVASPVSSITWLIAP